jgi:hypothetical protein
MLTTDSPISIPLLGFRDVALRAVMLGKRLSKAR